MKLIMIIMALSLFYMKGLTQQNPVALTNAYLEVKDALVRSDSKHSSTLAITWLKAIEAETDFKEKAGLIKSVQKITKTTDIEAQRAAFAEASVLMWSIVKRAPHFHMDVYYQYCPMKGTYWLSAEAAIRNPYYGSAMLTCGNVSDKKLH
jgi:hypothetical protein